MADARRIGPVGFRAWAVAWVCIRRRRAERAAEGRNRGPKFANPSASGVFTAGKRALGPSALARGGIIRLPPYALPPHERPRGTAGTSDDRASEGPEFARILLFKGRC
jgi:hypothetical protein